MSGERDIGGTSNEELVESLLEQMERKDERIDKLSAELQRLREEMESGPTRPDPPPNDQIESEYLAWKDRSETTHKCDESVFRRIREHTDDKPFPEFTTTDIHSWIECLDVKPTTGYDYLSRLSALFDWMGEKEWADESNPAKKVRRRYRKKHKATISRTGQNTGTVLDPAEFATLLQATYNKRARALLVLGVKTGLRRKQLIRLERADLHVENKLVLDRYPKGVGTDRLDDNSADKHPIDDEAVAVVSRWAEKRDREYEQNQWLFPGRHDGEHLSASQFTRVFGKVTQRGATAQRKQGNEELAEKLDAFCSHDLRRCFTSWLNWNNCPRDIISKLRGDANEDMVSLYTDHDEQTIRDEYEAAIPQFGLI